MNPLVSVLIPVYNAERFLDQALDSVFAQDYEPFEVIVLDDGSSDRSGEVASARPLRYISQPHSGIAEARNAALAASSGELIAFLDADDLWPAGKLELQVGHLLEHPEVDLVLGRCEVFVEPGTSVPSWFSRAWLQEPQHGLLQALVARRRAFDLVGPFNTAFDVGEDTEWFARAKDSGARSAHIDDICARYRIHGGNTTHLRRRDIAPALLKTMRATVRRQATSTSPSSEQ